jgi:hypothetical protein
MSKMLLPVSSDQRPVTSLGMEGQGLEEWKEEGTEVQEGTCDG